MAKHSVPTSKHKLANEAYLRGEYQKAIELQVEVVNDHIKDGKKAVTARKLLALYLYSSGELEPAVALLKTLEEETPEDSEVPENIGVMLRQSGKHVEAVRYLLKAHEMSPEKSNICDGLAHCFHTLKEPEQVQKFGRLSLTLKDTESENGKSWPIPDCDPPAFNPENRSRNVISFSLFGENPRYLHGALRNARLAADLYPGWTCRFYCDKNVPGHILKELRELESEVVLRSAPEKFYEGLLWRFEVIDDPTVDRFIVRDCDSVINIKERVAVDEWLASDKWFHMMRDFPSHTEMVLAGMWGGVSGVFPPLKELRKAFNPKTAATRTYDQHLLRCMVWPTMRQSVLIHDSIYTGCLESIPFPAVGQLPPLRNVGQNEGAVFDNKKLLALKPSRSETLERFFVLGLPGSGTVWLQRLLNSHPEILCPPEHHLSKLWQTTESTVESYQSVIQRIDEKNDCRGHKLDTEKLHAELYTNWLEHLFVHYTDDSVSHVGINDNNLDSNLPYHARMFPRAKFLFIVRDPRDVAVSLWNFKKKFDPGFDRDGTQLTAIAESVGMEWTEKIKNVQEFNQALPGKIELVRYEDLNGAGSGKTALKRSLAFLKVADTSAATLDLCYENADDPPEAVGVWKDALSVRQIDLIQKDAEKHMTLLQYEMCNIDQRSIVEGDTILPS
ncbi:MAG: sulfotransferase [Verrucomicrobiales bacterium]|nr:sulfotransferase [Verrucomicrobiales bacterium]